MIKRSLQYKESGVNYDVLDPLKRMAQAKGQKTAQYLSNKNIVELSSSRGESAYVIKHGNEYLAFVQEGLGTKSLVADAMYSVTGKTYYDALAQDTVAMIVNDIITVGAQPTVLQAYWATSNTEWFANKQRMNDLVKGWAKACDACKVTWGGGETPMLSGIIEKNTIDLGGSCFGIIKSKKYLTLGDKLHAGDCIVLFESSGIHANGISLARKIAGRLPKKYATKMPNGNMFGEEILKPTKLYSELIQDIFKAGIDIHYMANITGHGWRKLMRYTKPFTYRITTTPPVPEIFKFIMEIGPVDEREAYGNLNMGAGFAVYLSKKNAEKVIIIAKKHKIKAYIAGYVEEGKKQVIIEPKNITFEADSLRVR